MPSLRSDLALLGLAVVAVGADLACILTGRPAPAFFEQLALAGLTGAAGIALPFHARSATESTAAGGGAPGTYQPQSPAAADPYDGPVGL